MSPSTGGVGLPFAPSPSGPIPSAPSSLTLSPYWVLFYERDTPSKRLRALLGETPPSPSAAGGGTAGDWNIVNLPKRSAVTIWQGRGGLIQMDVPIILGDAAGGPVSPFRSPLYAMWRPSDPTVEPPVVKVRALGDIVPYQSLDYVVATIAPGDTVGGLQANRVLQKLTVTLLEFREDEMLQQRKAKSPKHRGRTYTVKAGDTLTSIAKRFKVKGGWRALGDAQHPPIRDPRKIKTGQRLLIP